MLADGREDERSVWHGRKRYRQLAGEIRRRLETVTSRRPLVGVLICTASDQLTTVFVREK